MDVRERIRAAARAAGVNVDEEQAHLLAYHLCAVLEANKQHNLTAIKDVETAVILHVLDSLLCLATLERAPGGRCIDLGSGAGFPGLPLAICTTRCFDLAESVKKKASFLSQVVTELGLDSRVHVIPERAESVGRNHPGSYMVVVARALSALPSLLELAAPLLGQDGWLIAMKGRLGAEELQKGEDCSRRVGMSRVSIERFELPDEAGVRACVVYKKTGEPQLDLPRREGLAQKRPLC